MISTKDPQVQTQERMKSVLQTDCSRTSDPSWKPTTGFASEGSVLIALKNAHGRTGARSPHTEISNYEVYRWPGLHLDKPHVHAHELISLHRFGDDRVKLRLDGLIVCEAKAYFVHSLPVQGVRIEKLQRDGNFSIGIWIQTTLTTKDETYNLWLSLQEPHCSYKRFFEPFLWVATFGKHVIDYLGESKVPVGLQHFQTKYVQWLLEKFGQHDTFHQWLSQVNHNPDMRTTLNACIKFVWRQTIDAANKRYLQSHPLWADCMHGGNRAIEEQSQKERYTTVTQHVYNCFQEAEFVDHLRNVPFSQKIHEKHLNRQASLGFARIAPTQRSDPIASEATGNLEINVGDVVSFTRNRTRSRESRPRELGLIQAIESCEKLIQGRRERVERLRILRIYHPKDTVIGSSRYPVPNEYFLTDQCNCNGEGWDVHRGDVCWIFNVDWSPTISNTTADIIVRQTYLTQQKAFVTVENSHKVCSCRKSSVTSIYHPGDAVYMRGQHSGLSEPVIVRYFDGNTGMYAVRLLKRLQEDLEDLARQMGRTEIADNELVLTSEVANIAPSQIEGACDIRFVPQKNVLDQQIPFPYRCGGTGDHWFVSMRLSGDGQHLFWMDRTLLALMGPSDDPTLHKRLRGLSLFSGGGGLDRGLEAAGAVEIKTVVEIDPAAIHTQRANSQNPDRVRFYCGSVNDYLKDSLLEPSNDMVAAVGEVDIILAGCPCQGLSAIQNNRQSERSLKNTSLVTTFCSFVDLLRPDRGILENVAAIGFNRIDRGKRQRGTEENSNDTEEDTEEQRTQNTLSQVIACLVSLGYQVNHFVMNSPDYGSVQRRSRMMITIAAPGLSPVEKPPQTHRPLDHSSDGSSLEQYSCSNAPFTQLVAGDRIGDLPNIGNGIVQMCIPFPDHRIACSMTKASREGLRQIPPRDEEERQNQSSRLCKNSLMPTIRTDSNRQNPKYGPSVHWDQDRILTIQEARRAQGWPDEEVIIGSLRKQYEIVGNGVERSVSYTLGQSLLRSVLRDVKSRRRTYVHNVEEQDGDEMATDLQHERERSSTVDREQMEITPDSILTQTISNSGSNNEVSAVIDTVKRKRKRISRREVQALCTDATKLLQRQAMRTPKKPVGKRRRDTSN